MSIIPITISTAIINVLSNNLMKLRKKKILKGKYLECKPKGQFGKTIARYD